MVTRRRGEPEKEGFVDQNIMNQVNSFLDSVLYPHFPIDLRPKLFSDFLRVYLHASDFLSLNVES